MLKLILMAAAVFVTQQVSAGVVICNPKLGLTKADIVTVYTGGMKSSGGVDLALTDNKSAMDDFTNKALSMPSGKYTSLWAKKSFQEGLATPKVKDSDNEVIEYVKSTPGGVGYISGATPAGVKEVGSY